MTLFGIRVPFTLYAPFICLLDFPFLLKVFDSRIRAKIPAICFVTLFYAYILANAIFHSLDGGILSLIVVTLAKILILIYLFFYFADRIEKFGLGFFYLGFLAQFTYVCYQQVSFNFFGGGLPLSVPTDLPFAVHDGGATIAASNFSGSEAFSLHSILKIRASGFTQEPSYLIAVCFPLLFTRLPRAIRAMLVFLILQALAKNAILAALICCSYYMVSRVMNDKFAFLLTLFGVIAAFAIFSPWAMNLGETFAGRFGPFYHYFFASNTAEKFVGVGMYNYSFTYGEHLIHPKAPPFGAFGGILIELGLVGFAFYVYSLFFIFKTARNKYLCLTIVGLLFSWGYFTAWPVWPFALALDRVKDEEIPHA